MFNLLIAHALQYLGYALEVGLIAVIVWRKRWKDLSAFSLYVVSFVLADVLLRPVTFALYGGSSWQYKQCYWFTDIALTLGAFLLICLFFRRACSERKALWSQIRTTLSAVFAIIIIISYLSLSEHYNHLFGRFIVDLQQNLYFACLVLNTVLYLILQNKDSEDGVLSLLVCGLGIEFAGPAAGMALMYLTPGGRVAGAINPLIDQLCNIGMFCVWIYAVARKSEVKAPIPPRRDTKKVPALAEASAEVKEVLYV
ncbi:MAG: hypothetical protein ACRD18_09430 [Terriglobia bacterium]